MKTQDFEGQRHDERSFGPTKSYFKRLEQPIVAIATAVGGPVAIIRLSGKDLKNFYPFFSRIPLASQFAFVKIFNQAQEVLDQGLLLNFKAPHSFTGEDILEIQCHGVSSILEKIVDLIIAEGALRALPGEFSFRAVVNEKMTLEEAEGIQLAFASEGLGSSWASKLLNISELGNKSPELFADLLKKWQEARGRLEAAIDFPEAEVEQAHEIQSCQAKIKAIRDQILRLQNNYENFVKNSAEKKIAIIGEPNVGKSTLINLVLGGERALVSEIAGTTRDIVESRIRGLRGNYYRLLDTAGLRHLTDFKDSSTQIEQKGIARAIQSLREADLIIYLRKANASEATDFIKENLKLRSGNTPLIEIFSHKDELRSGESPRNAFDLRDSRCGAAEFLLEAIEEKLKVAAGPEKSEIVVSKRQSELLKMANDVLHSVERLLIDETVLELAAEQLKQGEEILKKIQAKGLAEEYIGEIFSQFCLGK